MATSEAFLAAGLTYRQLDHWTKRGWLVTSYADGRQGSNRTWPQSEVRVARLMRTLIDAGMSVASAVELGRLGAGEHELAEGVKLVIEAKSEWPTAATIPS